MNCLGKNGTLVPSDSSDRSAPTKHLSKIYSRKKIRNKNDKIANIKQKKTESNERDIMKILLLFLALSTGTEPEGKPESDESNRKQVGTKSGIRNINSKKLKELREALLSIGEESLKARLDFCISNNKKQ